MGAGGRLSLARLFAAVHVPICRGVLHRSSFIRGSQRARCKKARAEREHDNVGDIQAKPGSVNGTLRQAGRRTCRGTRRGRRPRAIREPRVSSRVRTLAKRPRVQWHCPGAATLGQTEGQEFGEPCGDEPSSTESQPCTAAVARTGRCSSGVQLRQAWFLRYWPFGAPPQASWLGQHRCGSRDRPTDHGVAKT